MEYSIVWEEKSFPSNLGDVKVELILSCPERADCLKKKKKADAPKLNILLSKLEKNLDDLHFAITDD